MYGTSNTMVYWITEPGEYNVKVFVKNNEGEKNSEFTDSVVFEGLKPIHCSEDSKQKNISWIKNVYIILKEIWCNRMRMLRISWYDYNLVNKDSYLGMLWSFINPLIQIGTFWLVFGIGIRGNAPVEGHSFLPWMLCGLIPWFFFNACIVNGASSIYSKSGTVLKLKYPVSTIPVGSVFVGFYNHIVLLLIFAGILFLYGYFPNLYWLNLLYYMTYEIVFLVCFSLVTSVLTMIARDFQKLLNSVIRLWFYLTPIFWSMGNMPEWMQSILKLNPALYIVNGYRDSILYQQMFYARTDEMFFFWGINILLLVLGCNLQMKFRNKFIDML